jgi:hypothetical protein
MCRDERHQVELLTRFQADGLSCKALLAQGAGEESIPCGARKKLAGAGDCS